MSILSGKVALITGGSRGIGAETARQLAADGATVAISYNSSGGAAEAVVKQITDAGGRARAFQADSSNPQQSAQLVEQVAAAFGGLDILVNNAGVFVGDALTDDGAYEANFDVNVRGVYTTTRAAAPHLREGGRIVNIGSFLGKKSLPGFGAYNATKAAVDSFSRTWAHELASRKITVNTVSPGSIDTDMNPADADKNPGADFQRSLNPMGRYGKPADIAAAVRFLASPAANFITGANIPVDGGVSA